MLRLFLIFISVFISAPAWAGYDISIYDLKLDRRYTVVVITPRFGFSHLMTLPEPPTNRDFNTHRNQLVLDQSGTYRQFHETYRAMIPVGGEYGDLAKTLLEKGQAWYLEQLVARGEVERGSKLYNEISGLENIVDGRSGAVIIFDYQNPDIIRGMLRVSRRGTKANLKDLPLEKRMEIQLDQPVPVKKIEIVGPGRTSDIIPFVPPWEVSDPRFEKRPYEAFKIIYGDVVELKNFSLEEGQRAIFLPPLLMAAELSGLTTLGRPIDLEEFKSIPVEPGGLYDRDIDIPHKDVRFHEATGGLFPDHHWYLFPSKYVLECHANRENYYRHFLFEKDLKHSNEKYGVMEISRPQFKKVVQMSTVRNDSSPLARVKGFEYFRLEHQWKPFLERLFSPSCIDLLKLAH